MFYEFLENRGFVLEFIYKGLLYIVILGLGDIIFFFGYYVSIVYI